MLLGVFSGAVTLEAAVAGAISPVNDLNDQ